MKLLALSYLLPVLAAPASADILWTGAVDNDIFNEGNWDLTGSTVTIVDPNVSINDNVVIRNAAATVEIPAVAAGQFRFQVGDGFMMTVDNSRVVSLGDDGVGRDPVGVSTMPLSIVNGASFEPFFVVNSIAVDVDATSTVIFGGGGNPVNLSTVNLTFGATMRFLLEDPTEYTNEHLSKTTVDGLPAVINLNLDVISDGAMGSIITVRPNTIGVAYCPAVPNTTGQGANLTAMGSATAAANNVALSCSDVPANQFGFFLTGMTQGLVMGPGGSQGNLCLGGVIGRYVASGQIMNAGPGGVLDLTLDLTQTPAGAVFVAIAAGETWNFQTWFRDIGPMGQPWSNFSNGLSIAFN